MADWTIAYLDVIDECEQQESKLSDWERNFLDSIRNRLNLGFHPTSKQIEILDNIRVKVDRP